jgi:hypothetical protein
MQVYKNFIDTRLASAPADIMPRGHPYLHKIAPKDPVELENHGYVRLSIISSLLNLHLVLFLFFAKKLISHKFT